MKPCGLLQTLAIPTQVWRDISMDFITHLSRSQGEDSILVVVDGLTKSMHFVALQHPFTSATVANLFFDNVLKLHRDPTVTSSFWNELFTKQGFAFNCKSTYHPETDRQTEETNLIREQYLRCFSGRKPHVWTKWLAWAEFYYNTGHQAAIKMGPFEALHNMPPPTLLSYILGTARLRTRDQ